MMPCPKRDRKLATFLRSRPQAVREADEAWPHLAKTQRRTLDKRTKELPVDANDCGIIVTPDGRHILTYELDGVWVEVPEPAYNGFDPVPCE